MFAAVGGRARERAGDRGTGLGLQGGSGIFSYGVRISGGACGASDPVSSPISAFRAAHTANAAELVQAAEIAGPPEPADHDGMEQHVAAGDAAIHRAGPKSPSGEMKRRHEESVTSHRVRGFSASARTHPGSGGVPRGLGAEEEAEIAHRALRALDARAGRRDPGAAGADTFLRGSQRLRPAPRYGPAPVKRSPAASDRVTASAPAGVPPPRPVSSGPARPPQRRRPGGSTPPGAGARATW
jgi:hypothetical protein